MLQLRAEFCDWYGGGYAAERQAQLTKQYNADKWGIRMIENHLLQEFHPERIIYLSGDAEEEIVDFEEGYRVGNLGWSM